MTQLATLTQTLAKNLQLGQTDPAQLVKTLKATAFSGSCTDDQMVALLVVANQYKLNPWLKEIYAFPDKNGGIVPIVGVDGWNNIMNSHPEFDGVQFEQTQDKCTCTIFRKDRSHPTVVTEFFSECNRSTGPWKSHPMRMLRHKAQIQACRVAFGFAGIHDPDEAERIIVAQNREQDMGAVDLVKTEEQDQAFRDYQAEVLPVLENAATWGMAELQRTFKELPAGDMKAELWKRQSKRLKELALHADAQDKGVNNATD